MSENLSKKKTKLQDLSSSSVMSSNLASEDSCIGREKFRVLAERFETNPDNGSKKFRANRNFFLSKGTRKRVSDSAVVPFHTSDMAAAVSNDSRLEGNNYYSLPSRCCGNSTEEGSCSWLEASSPSVEKGNMECAADVLFLGSRNAELGNSSESAVSGDFGSQTDEFSASDDGELESAGLIGANPHFVRSFNRRLRTRDNRKRYRKRTAELDNPKLDEYMEKDEQQETWDINAASDHEQLPKHLNYKEISSSEERLDSDAPNLLSPGSDDVFWNDPNPTFPSDTSPLPGNTRDIISCYPTDEECKLYPDGNSTPFEAKARSPAIAQVDGCDSTQLLTRVGDEWAKLRDGSAGMSFLSRFAKNVAVKRKYGKSSPKTNGSFLKDKATESEIGGKESLARTVEKKQENVITAATSHNPRLKSLTPGTPGLHGQEDPDDTCYEVQRSKSLSPALQSEEKKGDEELLLPSNLGGLNSGENEAVLKPPKPAPPSKLKKPTAKLANLMDLHRNAPNTIVIAEYQRAEEKCHLTTQSSEQGRTRGISSSFYNLWPQLFSGTTGEKAQDREQTSSKKIDLKLETNQHPSLTPKKSVSFLHDSCPKDAISSNVGKPLQFPERTASERPPRKSFIHSQNPILSGQSFSVSQSTSGELLSNEQLNPNSSVSTKSCSTEQNKEKKSKIFSGFTFSSDIATKKHDSEKNDEKSKKLMKEVKISAEVKRSESRASTSPLGIKRVGAIKKSEDQYHLLDDGGQVPLTSDVICSFENCITSGDHQIQPHFDGMSEGRTWTGAIPKSSPLNKASNVLCRKPSNVLCRDEIKTKLPVDSRKSEPKDLFQLKDRDEGIATGKPSNKSSKKRRKPSMERSISVPFWTKLSSFQDREPVIPSVVDEATLPLAVFSNDSTSQLQPCKEVKQKSEENVASNPAVFQRKLSHKRTRSHDITKTFKDDCLSLAPERSASHDNLANLKKNEKFEMLDTAVDSESLDHLPQMKVSNESLFDAQERKTSLKHRSCGNMIDRIGATEPRSPKFSRPFKDSRLRSASALCLANNMVKKGMASVMPNLLFGEDSSPSLDSMPSWTPEDSILLQDGPEGESQHPFISPYELTMHARDKPYFQRLMGMFSKQVSDAKMDSLVQQLDLYSRQGIPRTPHLSTFQMPGDSEEVVLEDSWRTLVESHDQLDDRQEQQQSAIWELVETEATYIHMLKVITDLFLACLYNLQSETLLNEIDTHKLFSNIQEIYNANLLFWRDHIVSMLEEARSTRQPLDPTSLTQAFLKFDEIFHPYTRYCLDQSHCQQYCKEKDHDNEYFKMYLAWCETQKECNRLRLVDILVQPMQRLTKYSLLLKAILKKTTMEDHKSSLQKMISHVETFVSNVNSALRHKHEQERLRDIAKRIEAYEAVEARDDELEKVVRNYSDLSLTQPMPGCPEHLPRHILHHGDLRLRDPHTSKMDVHVFLFTDLLLITKVTQRKAEKVKVIRPPYHIERLVLVDLKDSTSIGLVSINEWNVAVAAFTLQCPDQRTYKTWYEAIKRAKDQYQEAQQARDVMGYEEIGVHLAPRSPRPGSSRASRVSSLAHSHSGSIDLNEPSPVSSYHPPSVDMSDVRASSASSDDSVALTTPEIQRSRSLEGGGCGATSPRPDRRPAFPKTPNTLSVTPIPYSTGQSLPNLTVESANSLQVPGSTNPKALSPGNRGVSYPPPSPRTLRRSAPVPQSRNPPLIKSRHVTSMVGSPQELEHAETEDAVRGGLRRISRTDRMDNRRYHTAGAIDDIKKQDTKDATIHKRLSWNYGQGPPPTRDLGNDPGKLGRHKHTTKSLSCESVHSSSGVSSTSSLHRSMGSELEALENIDDNELEDGEGTVVDLTVSDCTSLKISPHISTTYICHDSDITLGVCSQYITQPESAAEPGDACENLVKIDVSETDPGISSVQITVTEGATSSSSSSNLSSSTSSSEGVPAKPADMRMREILLNDASVEASDV